LNSSFVNLAGATVENTGKGNISQIATLFTNNGTVTAGTDSITEFMNMVNGTGTFILQAGTLQPGGALQFDTAVAPGSALDFASTTGGALVMLDSQQFGAAIHGFGGTNTDALDLRDISFTSSAFKLGYSGSTTKGVLTVTDGTHTAHLTMFGNYTTANFHASANSGGTMIVDPPAHPTLLAFGQT